LKSRIGSSKHKVIGNGTIEKIMHDLLLIELFDVAYYRGLEMWSLNFIENCAVQ